VPEIEKQEGKYLVMLAESDAVMEGYIRAALEAAGFSVSTVSTNEAAMAGVRELSPDVLILDSEPPGMDCEKVCRNLSDDELVRGIPIIVLSSSSDSAEKILAFQLGAKRFIHKPFDMRELVEEVRKSIEQLERTKQIKEYRDRCGGSGDFGAVPPDFKEQIDTCDYDGEE